MINPFVLIFGLDEKFRKKTKFQIIKQTNTAISFRLSIVKRTE